MEKHLKISFWVEDGPGACPLKRAALAPERACTKAGAVKWVLPHAIARIGTSDTGLPRLATRAGSIRSRTSFDFDRPHGLADQRAHIAAVKTMSPRLMRARSSRDLHKWASGFQLAASITLICAGCALMRWSKSTLLARSPLRFAPRHRNGAAAPYPALIIRRLAYQVPCRPQSSLKARSLGLEQAPLELHVDLQTCTGPD